MYVSFSLSTPTSTEGGGEREGARGSRLSLLLPYYKPLAKIQNSLIRNIAYSPIGGSAPIPPFTLTAQKVDAYATAMSGISLDRGADLRYQPIKRCKINKPQFNDRQQSGTLFYVAWCDSLPSNVPYSGL